MNINKTKRKNPISFQLAFSQLEIFANQLWRTSLPDKVDLVYGRIWLHTLELAHRWKQTTAEDALAGIDFSFDDSTDQSRLPEWGRGNSSEIDDVWCHPNWRSARVSVSAKKSEKCECREGQLGKLHEIHDGGVEKEKFKNMAETLDNHQINWFQHGSNYPSLRNVTNHRNQYLTRCSLVPGEDMLETAKYNTDSLAKKKAVFCDQSPISGFNEADWDTRRNCFCYSNPFDPRLYFKGIFPASVKHPESKNSASDSQNGKTLAAATVSMSNQHTENLFLSICNISAAFEQYVSGYRLFRLSLVRAPSISVPDDNQLSPRFRFSEPGCLSQADVGSFIRIPVDLSGADDGLIRLVQAIQSDQVRLLWLLPSGSSASPPLSYLPPPNEKNRSSPGPIRRPFAVPWRFRHKDAYATSRSRCRNSVNASLQLELLESDLRRGSSDPQEVLVNKQRAVVNTNVIMPPPPSFIQMPKPVHESASVDSSATQAVGSTRRPASATAVSQIPRPNCLLKRKISCARQDVGSKKDWSRLTTWSRALSTKGRLWDDNDLLVTESSKDFDDLVTRHRLLVRRSLSDPDLCSLTSVGRKQAARVASVQCCVPGKELQHHGDRNVSNQSRHLFSSYRMAWVPGHTSKTGDEASYHSPSANALPRNSGVMPCQFEELWVSSGLERGSSNLLAPPQPLHEQVAKSSDSSSVTETAREDLASKTIRIGHGVAGGIPLVRLVTPRKMAPSQCIVVPASQHIGATVASSSSFHHCTDVVLWKNPGLVLLHHTAAPVGLKPSLPGEMDEGAESRCAQRRVMGSSGLSPLIRLNAIPTEPYKALLPTLPTVTPSSQGQNVRLVAHQGIRLGQVLVNQPRIMVPCPALSAQRLHSGDIVDAGEPDRLCVVRDLPSPNPSFHRYSFPQCVMPRTVTQVVPIAHNQPLQSGPTKSSFLDSCGGGGWISSWQPPSHSTFSTLCQPRPEPTGVCFANHQANHLSLGPQRLSYPTNILKHSLTGDVVATANRFGDVALPHSDNRVLVPHLAFHSSSLERSDGDVEFQRNPVGALLTDMKPSTNLSAEALPFISHKFLGPSNSQTFSLGVVCPQWPPVCDPARSLQLDTK